MAGKTMAPGPWTYWPYKDVNIGRFAGYVLSSGEGGPHVIAEIVDHRGHIGERWDNGPAVALLPELATALKDMTDRYENVLGLGEDGSHPELTTRGIVEARELLSKIGVE